MKPEIRKRLVDNLAALSDCEFVTRVVIRCNLDEPRIATGVYLAEAVRRLFNITNAMLGEADVPD